MFNPEKSLKRLTKLNEIPNKKIVKTLDGILLPGEFRPWFFGEKDSNSGPTNKTMITTMTERLVSPKNISYICKYVKEIPYDSGFDRTSAYILMLGIQNVIDTINQETDELTERADRNEADHDDLQKYRKKIDVFSDHVGKLTDAVKEKIDRMYSIKKIAKEADIDRDLVYSLFVAAPDLKYVPKYQIGMFTNNILTEIYDWAAKYGLTSSSKTWEVVFSSLFTNPVYVPSVCISILLEGVTKIDKYSESEYFDDVRTTWDELSMFALNVLDKSPENIRNQMIEIYLKRANKIVKHKGHATFRVDLMDLPSRFNNLSRSVREYTNTFVDILVDKKDVSVIKKDVRSLPNQNTNVVHSKPENNYNEQPRYENQSRDKRDDNDDEGPVGYKSKYIDFSDISSKPDKKTKKHHKHDDDDDDDDDGSVFSGVEVDLDDDDAFDDM